MIRPNLSFHSTFLTVSNFLLYTPIRFKKKVSNFILGYRDTILDLYIYGPHHFYPLRRKYHEAFQKIKTREARRE